MDIIIIRNIGWIFLKMEQFSAKHLRNIKSTVVVQFTASTVGRRKRVIHLPLLNINRLKRNPRKTSH